MSLNIWNEVEFLFAIIATRHLRSHSLIINLLRETETNLCLFKFEV